MTCAPVDPAAVAATAARRAGVRIRPLATIDEMAAACRLLDDVWEIPPGETSEVRPSLLRALEHAGNYLVAAHLTDGPRRGEMVAASVAFFGSPVGRSLHSHITGVRPGAGRGIGAAVKWHQRAWAIERGLSTITWTYDPLIARNSYFNVCRLGARPERYHVDFYGPMDDGPNRGQPTDRVDAVWDLHAGTTTAAASRVAVDGPAGPRVADLLAEGAAVLLSVGPDGEPVAGDVPVTGDDPVDGGAGVRLIGIPPDIEALRHRDRAAALRWRHALRDVLGPALAGDRLRVTGFAKPGWYVLEPAGR